MTHARLRRTPRLECLVLKFFKFRTFFVFFNYFIRALLVIILYIAMLA